MRIKPLPLIVKKKTLKPNQKWLFSLFWSFDSNSMGNFAEPINWFVSIDLNIFEIDAFGAGHH